MATLEENRLKLTLASWYEGNTLDLLGIAQY